MSAPPPLPPASRPQPPGGELSAAQQAALEKHGLTLEHSLQDGPLSKQVQCNALRFVV